MWRTTRATCSCWSRPYGSSPRPTELPVNVRFAFDGEEEVGGDSIVDWLEQDEGRADAALILDGGMVRRGQPAFAVGVRGMLYFHIRVRTGTTDMHSGMFGAAVLNATHALMAALANVVPRADGRLRDELREGATPPSAEELEAWAQLPPGAEQLSPYGAVPIVPGAERSSTSARSPTRRSM